MLFQDLLKANLILVLNEIKSAAKNSDLKQKSYPNISKAVADKLAGAYDSYAKSATAGSLTTLVPPVKDSLSAILMTIPNFAGWGAGLLAYWSPVVWAGAGFIPANPTVAAAVSAIDADLSIELKTNRSIDDFAGKLAELLHKYTGLVLVTATTTSVPPVVSTIPLA